MTAPVNPLLALPEATAASKPTRAADAAQQFESLLIAQLLRSAWDSGLGGADGDEEDSQMSVMRDLAGQQFAQALAKQGVEPSDTQDVRAFLNRERAAFGRAVRELGITIGE
mgnify:CR=1 FL=1